MQQSVSSVNVTCAFPVLTWLQISRTSPLHSTQGTQAHCYVGTSEIPMQFNRGHHNAPDLHLNK